MPGEIVIPNEYTVSFNNDQQTKEQLFKRVLEYFEHSENFNAEQVIQSDDAYQLGAELLAEIAEEIFQFYVVYADDDKEDEDLTDDPDTYNEKWLNNF